MNVFVLFHFYFIPFSTCSRLRPSVGSISKQKQQQQALEEHNWEVSTLYISR